MADFKDVYIQHESIKAILVSTYWYDWAKAYRN